MVHHRMSRLLLQTCIVLGLVGCAGRILQHEKSAEVLKTEEYDQKVDIKETGAAPTTPPPASEVTPPPPATTKGKGKKKKAAPAAPVEVAKPKAKGPHMPSIEDAEGFEGRRPKVDPFRIGEKVTLNLSYFNIVAGEMDIEVKPFAQVNGEKAYHFEVRAKSNSFFDRIYAVDDKAVTYVSYDTLVPYNLVISLKESKQLAETRTLFDWKTNKATYWKKRITKEGEENKKIEWDIQAYSQNVISVAYYLRTFQIEPGKKLAIRVVDEGKNIVFTGEVLRRETLDTEIGKIKTVVIQPKITVDGVFSPIGDVTMWLTDDDRKFIVRLESKIKIGTIVAKLKSIQKGQE